MTIFLSSCKHAYSHVTIRLIPYVTLSGSEQSTHMTRHGPHQSPCPSCANWSPRLEDSTPQCWHSGSRALYASDPDIHLVPHTLNWVHIWTPNGQSMTSTSCCAGKAAVSCAWLGVALCETYRNFRPQMSPRQAYHRQEIWSNVGGWGFHPAPPVHSSGGWHPIPWQSLPLPAALTSTTITVEQHEARLITEDIRHSLTDDPLSVRTPPHTASQSQSGTPGGTPRLISSSQKPVYNALNWQPTMKLADHLHSQTRRWNDCPWPFGSTVLWNCGLPRPSRFCWFC